MDSKKLKRQLFGAVMATLLCLVSLGGATYAWYVNNTKVTAENISITAHTDGTTMEITVDTNSSSEPVFTPGQIEATLGLAPTTAIEMYPIHPTINADKSITWGHAISNLYDDAAVNADMDTLILTSDTENHVLKSSEDLVCALVADFYVRLNPTNSGEDTIIEDIVAKNVQITDNSSDQDNLLKKCVYLVVASDDGVYEITNSSVIDASPAFVSTTESGVLIDELATTDEYKTIRVYAFFDGKDADCKSSQYKEDSFTITVDFEGTIGHKAP